MLATALIAAAIALSAAATASAGKFFGVVALQTPSGPEFQRMAKGGAGSVRQLLYWGEVEPQPGVRSWAAFDAAVANAAAAGVKTVPLLFGTTPWVSQRVARPPIYTSQQRQAWAAFVTDASRRYGRGGLFWTLHPELPHLPVTDWLVWNEANLIGFWDGPPRPRRYGQLLRVTHNALVAGDGSARVFTGGLFREPRRGFGISATRFLQGLYRVRGIKRYFDGVALHPFSSRPSGVLDGVREARRTMNRRRDRRTPIWVTEVGWTTGGRGLSSSPYRASRKGQARHLSRTFRLLLRNRKQLRLRRVLWHAFRDYYGAGRRDWTLYMGLFASSGAAKPAWTAFAKLAGGKP